MRADESPVPFYGSTSVLWTVDAGRRLEEWQIAERTRVAA